MSLLQSFTVTQNLSNPTCAYLIDTSSGTDTNVTERRVYFKDNKGNYLVPKGVTTNYVSWAYASQTKLADIFSKDYCLLVTVNWVNASGTTLYTSQQLAIFTLFSENALFLATQKQVVVNGVITDTVFYDNKKKCRVEVDSAYNAFDNVDITNAQNALDRATQIIPLIANPNTFIKTDTVNITTFYTASWWWGTTDPYTALHSSDTLTYQGSGLFLSNTPIVADVHAAPINQFFVIKEPITQPAKTAWIESPFNFGTLNNTTGDSVFRAYFEANGFRYYCTRALTTFSNDPAARLTLIP